jgi:hypothetical protein
MIELKREPKFKTISGVIPGARFATLYSNPYVIYNQSTTTITPVSFQISMGFSNRGSITFFMYGCYPLIFAQLPQATGAFAAIRQPNTPGDYCLGVYSHDQGHPNNTQGGQIVFMTEKDDPSVVFNSCPFIFGYYERGF